MSNNQRALQYLRQLGYRLEMRFPWIIHFVKSQILVGRISMRHDGAVLISKHPKFTQLANFVSETRIQISTEELLAFANSPAENLQDFLAYIICGKEQSFVEFGGADGVMGSNTYILEKLFNWKGILCEPIEKQFHSCQKKRNARVVQAVVVGQADNSQQKEFWEVEDSSLKGLSTILEFRDSDFHSQSRMRGMSKSVKAIKIGELIDLTKSNNVSYLSVDTEGSELEIFKNFPFEKYSFGFVTVEHNYAPQMSNLDEIFTRSGYLKILHKYSANESWYINNNWESIRGDEMQPNEKLRIEKLVSLNHDLS